jgi:hypothetical protein
MPASTQEAPPPSAPALKMPEALLGKWRKEGGKGWHVFESLTLHYWTDGKKRNDHKIALKEKDGAWYIYWADIERPSEKVEIALRDGKTILRKIPATRMGSVSLFTGGFAE